MSKCEKEVLRFGDEVQLTCLIHGPIYRCIMSEVSHLQVLLAFMDGQWDAHLRLMNDPVLFPVKEVPSPGPAIEVPGSHWKKRKLIL